jgi:hypothetical protein
MGAAELAAHRDDPGSARELWAIGMRLGANVTLLFHLGLSARLAGALGGTGSRDAELERWRTRPATEAADRIRVLTATLL